MEKETEDTLTVFINYLEKEMEKILVNNKEYQKTKIEIAEIKEENPEIF